MVYKNYLVTSIWNKLRVSERRQNFLLPTGYHWTKWTYAHVCMFVDPWRGKSHRLLKWFMNFLVDVSLTLEQTEHCQESPSDEGQLQEKYAISVCVYNRPHTQTHAHRHTFEAVFVLSIKNVPIRPKITGITCVGKFRPHSEGFTRTTHTWNHSLLGVWCNTEQNSTHTQTASNALLYTVQIYCIISSLI